MQESNPLKITQEKEQDRICKLQLFKSDFSLKTFLFIFENSVNTPTANHSLMERLSRSGSVRENGSRKSASVGANVFDRLAKGGAAAGPRRGSGALETLNSPRAVSAARSPLTNDDSSANDNRRNDVVKRGTLTKIKDLVFQIL